ncbi:MAG: thioesterase family protein [Pseudomonadota bacterium]
MRFDEIRARAASGHDVVVPASWRQGRTVYGGLSAALLTDAVSLGIGADRRLRYLNVSFLKPLEADKPFTLVTEPVSSGRTITVQAGQIVQDGVTRVAVQANFVAELDGRTVVESFQPPVLPSWDDDAVRRMGGPGAPECTQYFDFRAAIGGLPFQGQGSPDLGGWMRFDPATDLLSAAHLVCLTDVWPPVPASYLSEPAPMSTVNWVLHFADPVDDVPGDTYIGYLAHLNYFRRGYGSSSADLWAPDGRLLAKSFQTFVVYG